MNTKYVKVGTHYELAITTDRSGRASIVIHENPHCYNLTIIDVELPAKTGEYANSFIPTVKIDGNKVNVERLGT